MKHAPTMFGGIRVNENCGHHCGTHPDAGTRHCEDCHVVRALKVIAICFPGATLNDIPLDQHIARLNGHV